MVCSIHSSLPSPTGDWSPPQEGCKRHQTPIRSAHLNAEDYLKNTRANWANFLFPSGLSRPSDSPLGAETLGHRERMTPALSALISLLANSCFQEEHLPQTSAKTVLSNVTPYPNRKILGKGFQVPEWLYSFFLICVLETAMLESFGRSPNIHAHIHTCKYTHIYARMHICTHMHVDMYTHVHKHTRTCTCIHKHTYAHTDEHTHTSPRLDTVKLFTKVKIWNNS